MRLLFALLFLLTACQAPAQITTTDRPAIVSIYWSDGDSGKATLDSGELLPFRLNDIDAPETGGVGAAIGGAKCEAERALGFEAKAWAVEYTRGAELTISETYGDDRHERLIIDLSVNGQDLGSYGILLGHYRSWKHDGKKALEARPLWCAKAQD